MPHKKIIWWQPVSGPVYNILLLYGVLQTLMQNVTIFSDGYYHYPWVSLETNINKFLLIVSVYNQTHITAFSSRGKHESRKKQCVSPTQEWRHSAITFYCYMCHKIPVCRRWNCRQSAQFLIMSNIAAQFSAFNLSAFFEERKCTTHIITGLKSSPKHFVYLMETKPLSLKYYCWGVNTLE